MKRPFLVLVLVSATALAQPAATTESTLTTGTTVTAGTATAGTATAGSGTSTPAVAESDYQIIATLVPKSLIGSDEAILYITVKASKQKLDGTAINVWAYGYKVDPADTVIIPKSDATQFTAQVKIRHAGTFVSREGAAVIRVVRGEQQLAVQTFPFSLNPILDARKYLALGLVGVLIGYLVRLALKIAKKQAQQDAAAAKSAVENRQGISTTPSWLETWISNHFNLFDCIVTLIIGGLVLISMMQDGRPPATTGFWHNALTTGFGLGVLTNSDLITRFKTP